MTKYKRRHRKIRNVAKVAGNAAVVYAVIASLPEVNRTLLKTGFGGIRIDDTTADQLSKVAAAFISGTLLMVDIEEIISQENKSKK